nr:MAG TPA: hypothetical protein [Podoviridae sp. ctY3D12]
MIICSFISNGILFKYLRKYSIIFYINCKSFVSYYFTFIVIHIVSTMIRYIPFSYKIRNKFTDTSML